MTKPKHSRAAYEFALIGLMRLFAVLLIFKFAAHRLVAADVGAGKQHLKVRVSWGHNAAAGNPFRISLSSTNSTVAEIKPYGFEPGDMLVGGVAETHAGGGDVDAIIADVSWIKPAKPHRKPHSIWQYLFDHGSPDQVARLRDDPGLTPDAPVLTVLTAADSTRGFSIGLDQLVRHKAMWLPEHDVFVTTADAPVEFGAHVAALKGERVLDRVRHEQEATLAEWTNRWTDFGNPTRAHHGQETGWMGTKGHLTGLVARHGSLYKFGVDRWASVRPDYASPHKFRFDLVWPGSKWLGQRIIKGMPIIGTSLERNGQHCDVEQFAAQLGEVTSVLFTRVELTGSGPVSISFRLETGSTNRHFEFRQSRSVGEPTTAVDGAGRMVVVDRETGAVWWMIEPGPGLTVSARALPEAKQPGLEIECTGQAAAGETRWIVLKLASPPLDAAAAAQLASLDTDSARAATVRYWDEWLAQGARFDVPEEAVNNLFRANLWHALMLPRHRADERGALHIDLPYSNFAYGQVNADWPINQAVYVDYMIYGLRGHFAVAEQEFAAMYRTQQKPDGHVSGYADWGVYSPGMLYSIGQNFLLSRDRSSFERVLPASLKAIDWCLREVARGKENKAAPGLIVAPLNDLTHEARAWAFPNAYFVAAFHQFGRALAAFGHPRAGEVIAAGAEMKTAVERAFAKASVSSPAVQLADGTWNNYVPSDAMTPRRLLDVWYPTDVDCGPLHLTRLGTIDPRGSLASAMLNDHEDNLFLNEWGMANEPVYNQQATAYLWRDEPEAAIRAFYSMMACAFSHQQLTPVEHRWAWGQYYMPPSTDGAWFELYRNMLLNELSGDGALFVGQAVPRAWLSDGKRISIERAPTFFGPVNVRIDGAAPVAQTISATIEFLSDRRPQTLLVRLRHPQKATLRSVTVNGAEWKHFDPSKEWVQIPNPAARRYSVVGQY